MGHVPFHDCSAEAEQEGEYRTPITTTLLSPRRAFPATNTSACGSLECLLLVCSVIDPVRVSLAQVDDKQQAYDWPGAEESYSGRKSPASLERPPQEDLLGDAAS